MSNTKDRPLSPHLQIYRLPISALLSISHRISGVALTAGIFVLVVWLGAAVFSPDYFAHCKKFFASPLGQVMLFGWTLAFFYHMCAGIRHLVWDTGTGFEKPVYKVTNWVVIISALVLTVVAWILATQT